MHEVVVLVVGDVVDQIEAGVDVLAAVPLGLPAGDHFLGPLGAELLAEDEGHVRHSGDETAAGCEYTERFSDVGLGGAEVVDVLQEVR
ncbi:hypothetical protein [Streptomyces lavendulae]|uniref:hypothetical protein n=1 Tax=Streptomyces lavendulae TaxID=1914 RepID=UPI0033CA5BFB